MTIGSITFCGRALPPVEPERHRCPECDGRGYRVHTILERDGLLYDVTSTCSLCRGHGWLFRDGTAGPWKNTASYHWRQASAAYVDPIWGPQPAEYEPVDGRKEYDDGWVDPDCAR